VVHCEKRNEGYIFLFVCVIRYFIDMVKWLEICSPVTVEFHIMCSWLFIDCD
jgi:hypothetical protein